MKSKYFSISTVIIILTILIVFSNYRYGKLKDIEIKIDTNITKQQELINNRKYIVSVINAMERIIDTNISSQIIKINQQLPDSILNTDYKLSTELLWRYSNLRESTSYFIDVKNNYRENQSVKLRESLLLELTAFKLDLESILAQNIAQYKRLLSLQNKFNHDLDVIFEIAAVIFTLISLCLYYFLSFIKEDNKFKLHDLAAQQETKGIANIYNTQSNPSTSSNFSSLSKIANNAFNENMIVIEHSCQRLNYHNTAIKKQLSNQEQLILDLKSNHNRIKDIINNIETFTKNKPAGSNNVNLSFKLYAETVEINKNIDKNIETLNKENKTIDNQIQKNNRYITNIFKSSQKSQVIHASQSIEDTVEVENNIL